MAFSSIPTASIQVGKAIKKELWQLTKDNEDDLDSRITVVEAGANKVEVFNGNVKLRNNSLTLTGLLTFRASSTFTLLDAKIGIYEKGSSSGTLEMDVLKSVDRNPANFATVFTTKPSLVMASSSDFDDSTNAVFDGGQASISVGDHLRLDITSLPSPFVIFTVFLIGEFN